MNYETLIDNIKNTKPFAFSRYGDGEWQAIFGEEGENCDGHTYFKDMGKRLKDIVLSQPEYYMGMQPLAMQLIGDQINKFTKDLITDWVNADIFHDASKEDKMDMFFDAVQDKMIVLIAPSYLGNFKLCKDPLKSELLIEVPEKNCWLSYSEIKERLFMIADAFDSINFLFCSSMMSNVLIDDLYNEFGNKHILLDMGSVFDPYVNKNTRSYHNKIIERNAKL